MNIQRIIKHLFTSDFAVKRHFPAAALTNIEEEIKVSEAQHSGEIRFVVEAALAGKPLYRDQSAHQRAIDIFSQLRIWDTEDNNGLLIYLLLADHAVEIVADRGINKKVGTEEWQKICRQMEAQFKLGNFGEGVIHGVRAITKHLDQHFPRAENDRDELSNKPVLL